MSRTINIVKTSITYFFWTLGSLFFVLLAIPFSFLPAARRYDNRIYFFIMNLWSRFLVLFSFIRLSVRGLENVPNYPAQPALILINHTSSLDIPLTEMFFKGYPHLWMSNDYSHIPLFSVLLTRMNIVVSKEGMKKSISTLRKAFTLLKDKPRHLFVFPEGTRYDDGEIHEFYEGFVILAEKLRRPVIPVVIYGLHKILPKKSFIIDSSACKVKMMIGKPLVYTDSMSRPEFVEVVQRWFKTELSKMK